MTVERSVDRPVREVPPHCATCTAYVPAKAIAGMGECHRYAPTMAGHGLTHRGRWPEVAATDFCIEHPDAGEA